MALIRADSIFFPAHGFVRDKILLIKDGIIERIVDSGEIGSGTEVVDFPGFSISPPFCDYHLHFPAKLLSQSDDVLHSFYSCGIVRVFEGGDKDLSGIIMKEKLIGQMDVLSSGFAIYREGGYGGFIGKGVKHAQEARPLIDHLHGLGVDYIKVINSGVFMPESGKVSAGGFERDPLGEIIAYANGKGLPVICHANGDKAIRDAVESGASAIVHGFLVSDETLSIMAGKGVVFIPTVNALLSLRKANSQGAKERVEKLAEKHLIVIRRAKDKGVRVLPGSDSGPQSIPYGRSFLEELGLFKRAGLTPEEILASAVTRALREDERADFLVLDGLKVVKVFIGGVSLS